MRSPRPTPLPRLLLLAAAATLATASTCTRESTADTEPAAPGASADTGAAAATRADERLNVVLVVTDDLGYFDTSPYGNDFVETPNLQRMADEGLRFRESYASAAVCSPSRAAIQTGLTPARLGITEHFHGPTQPQPWMRVIPPSNEPDLATRHSTLAEDLRRAGYPRRLYVGKWHAGGNGPLVHGYERLYGGSAGYWLNSQYHWPYWNGVSPDGTGPYAEVVRDSRPGDYLTDVLTDRALAEITEAHAADEPFFLHVNYYAPHVPLDGKAELVAKYDAKKASYTGEYDLSAVYAAMVETIDANVGRLLDTLDALGLRQNTLVVFTSDNGGLAGPERPPFDPHTPATNNGVLRAGKGHLYEGGTRVPTIAWGGPVPAGRVSDDVHLGHDLYPTIAELAGAPLTGGADGVSHAGVYRGGPDGTHADRTPLWHYPHYSNQGGVPRSSLRAGDYKVIYDWGDSTTQLYDLRADLAEARDLAMCAGNIPDSLRDLLLTELAAQGAKLPVPNPDYDGG